MSRSAARTYHGVRPPEYGWAPMEDRRTFWNAWWSMFSREFVPDQPRTTRNVYNAPGVSRET